MAGSRRDSRRVLPRFWPPGFPFPAVNPGGIPPGFPPGPAAILAAGISVPRRESQRDLGGITTGISLRAESAGGIARRNFGRRVFTPRRKSRRDLGGITTGIPPRFWPPGFRFAPRIQAGTWREFLPRFLAAGVLLPAENPVGILVGSLTKILVAEIPVSR